MKRLRRIYIFSIYGALGGLVASFLHQHLLLETLSKPLPTTTRFIYLGVLGVLVGMSIGFFPSFSEGRANYSLSGAIRVGIIGAILGALGGLIALPLAEALHMKLSGGVLGRSSALAFLGLSIGIAEGIVGGARSWRGLVGGGIGGLVAGFVLERLLASQNTYGASGIVALMFIGLFISLLIAVFVHILAEAWLEGLSGSKVSGNVYHLSKFRRGEKALLGGDKKHPLFILIPGAQPTHAEITMLSGGVMMRHVGKEGETRVNGSLISERMLKDGDIIQIGPARFKYRERKRLFSSTRVGGPKVAHMRG